MALETRHPPAPQPSFRLIPSQFPPIGLFDTVSRAADLYAVMELAGWTNDRLVAERIARLPRDEWVFGRANSSIVMAAFLHAAPGAGASQAQTLVPGMQRTGSRRALPKWPITSGARPLLVDR